MFGQNVKKNWDLIIMAKQLNQRGGTVQWVARLTRNRWMSVSCEFETHQKAPLFT